MQSETNDQPSLSPVPEAQKPFDPRSIPTAILISGIFIAAAILFSGYSTGMTRAKVSEDTIAGAPAEKTAGALKPVVATDHIRGNASAPFIMVEFSDPECPYCKVFHATMQKLMSEYGTTGTLAWVYRNFPIDGLHKKAKNESQAIECANVLGGNDKYWQYLDEVFKRTNSNDSLDPAELPKIATSIGLDLSAFNECVAGGSTLKRINDDISDGIAVGVKGTPTSILLNTKTGEKILIEGAQPYDMVKEKIESAIKAR